MIPRIEPGAERAPLRAATGPEPATAEDLAFCRAALPRVSRTFALSIEALPEGLREAVRAAYLLCRVVDTIEDGAGLRLSERLQLFAELERVLGADEVDPRPFELRCQALMGAVEPDERTLCEHAGAVLRAYRALPHAQRQAIRPWVAEMARGMKEHVLRAGASGRLELESVPELERYCYFVAGTVGRLLTELFGLVLPAASPAERAAFEQLGVSFGIGLQLVNVLKDAADDMARGACFLPRQLATEAGIELAELLDPERRVQALSVIAALVERARYHLERAKQYTELWPLPEGAPVRLFCAVPLALALGTLDEIERGDRALRLGPAPKMSRETVGWVVGEAARAVHSQRGLRELWRAVSSASARSA
jgi:farnesyl-diphosphate farnesyltransferase